MNSIKGAAEKWSNGIKATVSFKLVTCNNKEKQTCKPHAVLGCEIYDIKHIKILIKHSHSILQYCTQTEKQTVLIMAI